MRGVISMLKFIDNVSIKTKLWLLAAIILALLLFQFVFTMRSLSNIRSATALNFKNNHLLTDVNDIRADFYSLNGTLNAYLLVQGSALQQPTYAAYLKAKQSFLNAYGRAYHLANPSERWRLAGIKKDFDGYLGFARGMFDALRQHNPKEALYLQSQGNNDVSSKLSSGLDDLAHYINGRVARHVAQKDASVANAYELLIIIFLISLIITIAFISVITGRLGQTISQLQRGVSAFAGGDLITPVPVETKDEIGSIGRALNEMKQRLATIISHSLVTANSLSASSEQLKRASEQAALATTQIAQTVQQVAIGNSQGAEGTTKASQVMDMLGNTIQQIAVGGHELIKVTGQASLSMEEIASAMDKANQSAESVVRMAKNAEQTAAESGLIVESTIAGMKELRDSTLASAEKVRDLGQHSNEIGSIVGVIAEMSAQTNLLALNATIEAARAGEHGRGFAVVADEVRRLAERSAASAKEINTLISTMQSGIAAAIVAMEEGSRKSEEKSEMAQEAAEALGRIVRAIRDINRQTGNVSEANGIISEKSRILVEIINGASAATQENTAATQEMAAESKQVMDNISDVAALSEENASAAEEISATTEELSSSAEEVSASAVMLAETAVELKNRLAYFKV